jgi:hypothetical protein
MNFFEDIDTKLFFQKLHNYFKIKMRDGYNPIFDKKLKELLEDKEKCLTVIKKLNVSKEDFFKYLISGSKQIEYLSNIRVAKKIRKVFFEK